jgi:hypothetical protein
MIFFVAPIVLLLTPLGAFLLLVVLVVGIRIVIVVLLLVLLVPLLVVVLVAPVEPKGIVVVGDVRWL